MWQLQLLYNVVHHIAGHGGIKELLERHGLLSMELSSIDVMEPFRDEEGRVGVLLGLDSIHIPPSIEGPASNIRLVSIKILTSRELQYVLRHGDAGRKNWPDCSANKVPIICPRSTEIQSYKNVIDRRHGQGGGRQPAKEPTCKCASARPLPEAIRGFPIPWCKFQQVNREGIFHLVPCLRGRFGVSMTPQRVLINGETHVTLLSNGQEGWLCLRRKSTGG